MKKTIVIGICAALLGSCSGSNVLRGVPIRMAVPQDSRSLVRTDSLAPDFAEAPGPVDIANIRDSILLVRNGTNGDAGQPFFSAFSMRDNAWTGSYGIMGRGPGEMLSPIYSGSFERDGKILGYLHDIPQEKAFSIDFSAAVNQHECISEICHFRQPVLYAFPYLDSLHFVVSMSGKGMRCTVAGADMEPLMSVEMLDGIDVRRALPQLSACFQVNDRTHKAAMFMMGLPQVNFIDLDSGKIRSVAVDRSYRDWKQMIYGYGPESVSYYSYAASNDTGIYAIYEERRLGQPYANDRGTHLHFFDWNGNFLCELHVPDALAAIAPGYGGQTLYGLTRSGEIVSYHL